jgi:hypothetical protein
VARDKLAANTLAKYLELLTETPGFANRDGAQSSQNEIDAEQ